MSPGALQKASEAREAAAEGADSASAADYGKVRSAPMSDAVLWRRREAVFRGEMATEPRPRWFLFLSLCVHSP